MIRRSLASGHRWSVGALVALAALWTVGCAPLNAATAIADADDVLASAKGAQAETLAPYPYWMAVAYLHKARQTEGYSEFGAAERFALRAKDLAQEGLRQAQEAGKKGKLKPPTTGPAPGPRK